MLTLSSYICRYYNPFLQYGLGNLALDAAASGVDGENPSCNLDRLSVKGTLSP